jgi:polysaccharide deacetylase 2 family uncharacterized protein YibQ
MTKRKRKHPSKNKSLNKKLSGGSKVLTYFAWSMAVIALVLSSLIAGYYFGYEEGHDDVATQKEIEKKEKLALLKKLEKKEEQKKIEKKKKEEQRVLTQEEDVKQRLKDVLKKPQREFEKEKTVAKSDKNETKKEEIKKSTANYATAAHEYEIDDEKEIQATKPIERTPVILSGKPKLAIIIDDVSVRKHVEAIKSLQLPLTMSFLPPSSFRPNSAKLAAKEKFYMVHLPMEAMSFTAEEPTTLRVNDSQTKISKRIEKLLKQFPKAKYINNHTGSKFTSNEVAMNRLMNSLKKHNINFIDSRTTAKTKVPAVMKNYGLKYIARDVFLDHHQDKPYVKKQIKEAIRIAKQHGSAIAIGHPHKNTLLALKESKKLFKDVELVYINKL